MPTMKQHIVVSIMVLALFATTTAQQAAVSPNQSLTITAAIAGERVRITAPAAVVQMRVEIYTSGAQKLFDQEIRGGNIFDWHLQDGQAQRLPPGEYVCVITAKSISGKLTQKIGAIIMEQDSVRVQPAEPLSLPQAQTIGPIEENSSWAIAEETKSQTTTVIAHDSVDGQIIRGRGALSFRIGDFFSGMDKEQMRLSEAGHLGIGTSEPKAKLDVAGTVRAQRFELVRATSADVTTDATTPELISGTGTQNRIAKWIDNSATLGDSGIFETAGGLVGIGTTSPGSKLVVSSNSAALPAASGIARFADADGVQTAVFADAFGTNPIFNVRRANGTAAAPTAVQANQLLGVIGASGHGTSVYSGTRARVAFLASENWTNTANGSYITFNTTPNGAATPGGTERVRIDNAGNVAIGTTSVINDKLRVEAASNQIAVFGLSSGANGVFGGTITGVGVQGSSTSGSGVNGGSSSGPGLFGISNTGPGLSVFSSSGDLAQGANGSGQKFHITNAGTYVTGSDFAEALPAHGNRASYEPGDVLVASSKAHGKVEKSSRPYDSRVAGIYSTRPGMLGADKNGITRVDKEDVPVAIVGIVPTKVSTINGQIQVGTLLTSSNMPGYAMRCASRVKCVGAVVGKALEPLDEGKGVIRVLVMLR